MEIQREGVGRGKQDLSQGGHPPLKQSPLVFAQKWSDRSSRWRSRLLGEDVQAGERQPPGASSKLKSLMCPTPFFVEELDASEAANGALEAGTIFEPG